MTNKQAMASTGTTVALVGNGFVRPEHASEIDGHDVVVRFNRAWYCGIYGKKTSVIAFAHFSRTTDGIVNHLALKGAEEFWFLRPPLGDDDRLLRSEKILRGRVWHPMDPDRTRHTLLAFKTEEGKKPSTGALAMDYALDRFPDSVISVFGFSHQGSQYHDWAAEKAWFDSLSRAGRIRMFEADDHRLRIALVTARKELSRFKRRITKSITKRLPRS
jgi:uncharacterized protein YggL (DUF469 family)